MNRLKADIVDIFSSMQGEGIFLGAKQIFVRFKRCNLCCAFCDEPRNAEPKQYSPLELMTEMRFLETSKGPHHSVSLTGGEPLLYSEFLKIFLRMLKKEKFKTYLETNGTLPDELSRVIDFIDVVAMDFKLPSSTGQAAFWDEHFEFLKISTKKKVFVKAVITPNTTREDIDKTIDLIKRLKANIPLVFQPATPLKAQDKGVDKEALLGFVEMGLKNNLDNVRVIPQVHKILKIK